jgi:hypothetical protein
MTVVTRVVWWLVRVMLVLLPALLLLAGLVLLAGAGGSLPSGGEVVVLWTIALGLSWVGTRRLRARVRPGLLAERLGEHA